VTVADQRGAEARLVDIVRSEVGSTLGLHPLSELVWTPPQESYGSVAEGTAAPNSEEPAVGMSEVMEQITRSVAERAREGLGVEVSAVRIKRLNFPRQNKQAVFQRMEAERERIAKLYRSEGAEAAEKVMARAKLEEMRLVSDARRRAEEIRGEADAEATRIYSEAYGADPDFYEFLRSLETYRSIIGENTTIVVPSDARLLEVLRDPEGNLRAGGGADAAEEEKAQ
jgi:membrane protease subunit HflC